MWIHNAAASGEEETRDIEAANRRLALASSGGAPQRLYDCHKGNVISDTVALLGGSTGQSVTVIQIVTLSRGSQTVTISV